MDQVKQLEERRLILEEFQESFVFGQLYESFQSFFASINVGCFGSDARKKYEASRNF